MARSYILPAAQAARPQWPCAQPIAIATPRRISITHCWFDIRKAVSSAGQAVKRSPDLEVDRGLFPPIALDLVLDRLSLV